MKIEIHHDPYAGSPREWDNLGILICSHRKYDLSDVPFPQAGENGSLLADFKAYLKSQSLTINDVIYTPVYMYDHSGIALSSTPFGCRWDSGQIGFNYTTKQKVRTEYSVKRISPKLNQIIIDNLNTELAVYSDYVEGNCYGFVITDSDDNHVDSCWGFYGGLDNVKQQMRGYIVSDLWEQLDAIDYDDVVY